MPPLKRKRPRIRKPSSPFVKITYFDNEGVRGAFDCYIAELVARRPDVTRVVLFGSVARGDAVPGSDVDLLIVLASADKPFLNRMAEFMPDRFPVGIDVFPHTDEEVTTMVSESNWFARRALREGEVLFERAA